MLAKKTKRFLASLLTAAMVVGLLPMSVLAAGDDTLTPGSKYYDVNGAETSESNAKVVLTKNAQRVAADEWEVKLSTKVNDIKIEQQPLRLPLSWTCPAPWPGAPRSTATPLTAVITAAWRHTNMGVDAMLSVPGRIIPTIGSGSSSIGYISSAQTAVSAGVLTTI